MNSSSAILNAIQDSVFLEPAEALILDSNLRKSKEYRERIELQAVHSRALLERMHECSELRTIWAMSESQRETPHFEYSLLLQELYARGLVLIAQKDSTTEIHQDSLDILFRKTRFRESRDIQRAIAALLLESIANCETPNGGRHLENLFKTLPDRNDDPEIKKMMELSSELISACERQPVVKVDLNQKTPGILRTLGKIMGVGDYRMRVWLGGSPKYKQVVVKVAARDEASARLAVKDFVETFLADESESQEIVDVFPPGSSWNSGRHPVLKLQS